ncbi:hypothetical protein ZWY2020_012425 [Hordeum vulgare]|nr:hypothetical protein ZWY2020_012425 [Hordeum vulgare]
MSEVWRLPDLKSMTHSGKEWLLNTLDSLPVAERHMLLLTMWRCWHVRNELVHNKDPPPVDVSRRFLCSYLDSLLCIAHESYVDPCKGKTAAVHTMSKPLKLMSENVPLRWSLPVQGWSKLNCNGSFSPDDSAGSGMVLRDEKGGIIFSSCKQLFYCRDALEAELGACMEGLSLALSRTDLPVAIEMESSVAVKMIQANDIDRSLYSSLVKEIKYLLNLRRTSITHISRSQNKVSNFLVNFARLEGRTMTWLGSGPPEAIELNNAECNFV